jgi:hypothetical protein
MGDSFYGKTTGGVAGNAVMKLTKERDAHHTRRPGALCEDYEASPGRRDAHFSVSTAAKMTAATTDVIARSKT